MNMFVITILLWCFEVFEGMMSILELMFIVTCVNIVNNICQHVIVFWEKKIILEYSSIPLFESFNGGNGKSIPSFGSLSGREWNELEGTLIPLYSLKTSNFHSPRNWEEWEGIELNLMNFLLKLPKYPYIFNHLF